MNSNLFYSLTEEMQSSTCGGGLLSNVSVTHSSDGLMINLVFGNSSDNNQLNITNELGGTTFKGPLEIIKDIFAR